MTDQQAEHLEAARRKREDALVLALLLAVHGAIDSAEPAFAAPAVRAALLANGASEIAQASAEAHLDGFSVYAAPTAVADAERDLPALVTQYAPAAVVTASLTADAIAKVIAGAKTGDEIDAALAPAGYAPENPYAIRVGVERNIVTASNGGAVMGGLSFDGATGLRHVSVGDDRTTLICDERDGLQLPVTDPYWLDNWPSLHFGCRSQVIVLFTDFQRSSAYPHVPPAPGFGAAPLAFVNAVAAMRMRAAAEPEDPTMKKTTPASKSKPAAKKAPPPFLQKKIGRKFPKK